MATDYTGNPDGTITAIELPDDNDKISAASVRVFAEPMWNAILARSARTEITESGSFSPGHAPDDWVHFLLVGGGGAGAYADNGGGDQGGGGGGAGAIVDVWLPGSEVSDELTVVIGAGGAATSDVNPENAGQATVVTAAFDGPWSNFLLTAPGGAAGDKDGPGGAGGLRTGDSDTPQGGATGGANGESPFARGAPGAGGGAAGGHPAEAAGDGGYSAVGCPGGMGEAIGQAGGRGRGYGAGGGGGRGGVAGSGGGGGGGGYGTGLYATSASGSLGGGGAPGICVITIVKGSVL